MSLIKIEESLFGRAHNEDVKLYKLKNKNGFELAVISYGATIQNIRVKDKNNAITDVSLGFDKIEEYRPNIYFGCTVGRVANRISNSQFSLNNVTYNLDKNNAEKHCLHGGFQGFSQKNWQSSLIENGVKFTCLSPDKDGGFPGEVFIEAIYTMDTEENKITIQYNAKSFGQATPVNITNHAYFNLAGKHAQDKIYNHEVKINANEYLDFNTDDVTVTGKINSVQNTKYDFTEFRRLSDRIKIDGSWPDEGYDNYFILTEQKENGLKQAAIVRNSQNGLVLDVKTNQKGIQFYSGNFLTKKKNGHYTIHQGLCLETHNYPNSVNFGHFPSCILEPNENYSNTTVLSFLIE